MPVPIIEITVRDRVATHVGEDYYICGNSDYVIHFDFDEEWDALDIKTARFIAEGNILYPDQIFSGSECPMPIIKDTNNIRVGVFAGNLQTSTPARVPAVKSILCGTGTPAAPEEDAYHQAMEEMAKVATSAKSDAASAAQSAVEADASAQAAAASAQDAGQHANDAGAHAKAAAKSASDAAASAENAEKAKQAAINNADDAEAAANNAKGHATTAGTWAGHAETSASNAEKAAGNAAASAEASAQSAVEAAASAQEAQDTAEAMTEDVVGSDGRGGLYIITCNGMKANRTQEEIRAAVNARKTVLLRAGAMVYTYFRETQSSNYDEAAAGKTCPTFIRPARQEDGGLRYYEVQVHEDNTITDYGSIGKTPNPYKLTFSGAVDAEYDGSAAVNVEIPDVLVVTSTIVDGKYKANYTSTEFRAAHDNNIPLLVTNNTVYTFCGYESMLPKFARPAFVASNHRIRMEYATIGADGFITKTAVENGVRNPSSLTFTGAVNASYDGSEAVNVEIPQGGGGTVETADDAEVLQALADIDMMTAVGGDDYVLTDENNNILEW